jgi:hypothetical protein
LVSDYLGTKHPDRFGAVGIFSPAYWAAPNYMAARVIAAKAPRVFLSMGTAESSTGESSSNVYWSDAIGSLSAYIRAGHLVNKDIVFAGVVGGLHNEPAWSRLLPEFFAFALDPRLEANPLLLENYPPSLSLENAPGGGLRLRHPRHTGFCQRLLQSTDLSNWSASDVPAAGELWDENSIAFPLEGGRRFWRVETSLP